MAAGVAGLLKVLLALRHGCLPPTLKAAEVNPTPRPRSEPGSPGHRAGALAPGRVGQPRGRNQQLRLQRNQRAPGGGRTAAPGARIGCHRPCRHHPGRHVRPQRRLSGRALGSHRGRARPDPRRAWRAVCLIRRPVRRCRTSPGRWPPGAPASRSGTPPSSGTTTSCWPGSAGQARVRAAPLAGASSAADARAADFLAGRPVDWAVRVRGPPRGGWSPCPATRSSLPALAVSGQRGTARAGSDDDAGQSRTAIPVTGWSPSTGSAAFRCCQRWPHWSWRPGAQTVSRPGSPRSSGCARSRLPGRGRCACRSRRTGSSSTGGRRAPLSRPHRKAALPTAETVFPTETVFPAGAVPAEFPAGAVFPRRSPRSRRSRPRQYPWPRQPRPRQYRAEAIPPAEVVDLTAVLARCPGRLDGSRLYAEFAAAGIEYGPSYQVIGEVRHGQDEALAALAAPTARAAEIPGRPAHPVMLDAALQAVAALGTCPGQPAAAVRAGRVRTLRLGPGRRVLARDQGRGELHGPSHRHRRAGQSPVQRSGPRVPPRPPGSRRRRGRGRRWPTG